MKIIILSPFLLLLLLVSCKKNIAAPEPVKEGLGTISFTIDANNRSFNYNQDNNSTANARLGTWFPNLYELAVYGQKLPGYFQDYFSITIFSPNPIIPGTYSFRLLPIYKQRYGIVPPPFLSKIVIFQEVLASSPLQK